MNDMPFTLPEPPGADEVRRLRQRLWQLGYAPVPVATGEKSPFYSDWPARARAGEFAAMDCIFDTAFASTGIDCAGLRAIDIDVDDQALVDAICAAAEDVGLPEPGGVRYRENSSRVLWLYRAAEGQPGKRSLVGTKGKIEILGRGQQFVADGMHHSGVPILWDSDLDFPECLLLRDELPALTEEQITRFFEQAAPIIDSPGESKATAAPGGTVAPPTPDELKAVDPAALAAIVRQLPNDATFDNRNAWLRLAHALAAAFADDPGLAEELWLEHAAKREQQVRDDGEGEAEFVWRTLNPPHRAGAEYIVKLARGAGIDVSAYQSAKAGAVFAASPLPADTAAGAGVTFSLPGFAPAVVPAAPPLPLLFACDIRPVLDTSEIVHGLIGERIAGVIFGESNSGKTFWTLDLALSIAAGLPWNGRRVERSGVVYAVLEGGNGFRNRVTAWLQAHSIDPAGLPFAAIPASLNLLDPSADTPRLIAAVTAAAGRMSVPVRLIVVDTLSRALAGGNENAPDHMGALVTSMDRVRAETGCAVLFVHHSGKDAAKGARGHSLLRAAVDTEIEVADVDGERTAAVVKQRDLPKGGVFGFRLRTAPLGVNRHGEPVTSCVVEHVAPASRPLVKAKPLPAQCRIVLDRLHAAVAAQGVTLPLGGGFPTSPTRGVQHEAWRAAAYDALGNLSAETRSRAFRRAVEEMAVRKLIETHGGFTWPAAEPENPAFAALAEAER